MSKIALTDAYLRKLKPTGKRVEITDASTKGLRARVSADGEITFILKVRDAAGNLPTVTIGRYPDISLKTAREEATRLRTELKAGRDINAERRAVRQAAQVSSSAPTLRDLLAEYQAAFSHTKKMWAPAGPRSQRSQAGRVIERVFAGLLDRDVTTLTESDFARAMDAYRPARETGKTRANGQVSRARAYLGPVLDWAAGRRSFRKIGAGRDPHLEVAGLDQTADPATDDPTITGKRDRVLSPDELKSVLPFLAYPAPKIGRLRIAPQDDYRPIALRFILHTAARLDEVCNMRWRDFDRHNCVWRKPEVKSTRGGRRKQDLPLPEAAVAILRALPGWEAAKPGDLAFPNATGSGKLGNWTRFQTALNEATGTSDWHRHDLRRTAASLMLSLKVPASTIEHILAHKDPFRAENLGGAASNYLKLAKMMTNMRDPQEEALAVLAQALAVIASENPSRSNAKVI